MRADPRTIDPHFALLFLVMLTIAAGNTALQSILPALGRSLGVAGGVSVGGALHDTLGATTSERSGRAIDHDQAASMEKKKREGYF